MLIAILAELVFAGLLGKILPLRSRVVAFQYMGESVLLQSSSLDSDCSKLAFSLHKNFFQVSICCKPFI